MAGRGDLQARIDALLRERPEEARGGFSPYLDDAGDLVDALWAEADRGDDAEAAVAGALALAEAHGGNRARLRHAVEVFVTNHPRVNALGLRVAPLVERAPHLVLPRGRGGA